MFPLVPAELGDFLIKGMREFVFLGGVAFTRWMHLFESREEWPAQRDGKGMAKRGRWREIDGERAGGGGKEGGGRGGRGKNLDDDKCFLRRNVIYAVIRIVATNHPCACVWVVHNDRYTRVSPSYRG